MEKVSAAQFLDALRAEGIHLIAKDKRVEYWAEPERVGPIRVADLLEKLKNRKKWYEREKFPGEREIDPRAELINPGVINQIAEAVIDGIRTRGLQRG